MLLNRARQDISLPVCVYVGSGSGLIEIWDSSTGHDGPLDECPWAPRRLSSLLGGWLSLGSVSCAVLLASIIYDSVNLTSGRSTCAIQPTTVNVSRMCSKR